MKPGKKGTVTRDHPKWNPAYVEDVLALAVSVQLPAFLLTDILERKLAAGIALAWQLQQFTGVESDVWLTAALPEAPEHKAFLAPPHRSKRLSAIDLVKSARGAAGRFWRPTLETYAGILGLPPALFAHFICGSLNIKSPLLRTRVAQLINWELPYGIGSQLPRSHELWVRPTISPEHKN